MIHVKLMLMLVANLVFIRLAFGIGENSRELNETSSSDHLQQSSIAALDQINSLDFNGQTGEEKVTLQAPIASNLKRRRKSAKSIDSKKQQESVANMLVNLLGQLEKVDVKKLILDSLAERSFSRKSWSSSNSNSNSNGTYNGKSNSTKPKERISAGALSNEAGNLLSITKQIVKLARSGVVGGEFGSPISWMSPLMVPSMLSAASHMMHDQADFTGASLKSDWFWIVAPAVIVIGAGVIVIPLIAAWLVSNMMSQNTFTVSAGRRRRRRDLSDVSTGIHRDLITLLDIHKLLDAPHLLVENLSRFHGALDSVMTNIIKPSVENQSNKKMNSF